MLRTPTDPAKILEQLSALRSEIDLITSEMSPRERLFLYTLALCLNPRRYLEIGSLEGGSALIVCKALDTLAEAPGKIFMIDPDFHVSPGTWNKIEHRATRIVGTSPDALEKAHRIAGGTFDLVLVDGGHDLVSAVNDITAVYRYVSPGGFVVIHDYSYFEVRQAVDHVLRQGLYTDVGLMIDETFDDGETCEGGRHHGRKCLWCGTYVLRRAEEKQESIGLREAIPMLIPPLFMPFAQRLILFLRSLVSRSNKT